MLQWLDLKTKLLSGVQTLISIRFCKQHLKQVAFIKCMPINLENRVIFYLCRPELFVFLHINQVDNLLLTVNSLIQRAETGARWPRSWVRNDSLFRSIFSGGPLLSSVALVRTWWDTLMGTQRPPWQLCECGRQWLFVSSHALLCRWLPSTVRAPVSARFHRRL